MTDGIALVDKPQGWTSHDVVARLRRMYGTRKVGHAGTLDPMATGLLIVGVNRGTKLLTYLVGLPKQYSATIRLGVETVTEDAEGEITRVADRAAREEVDISAIDAALAALTGAIEQVPSAVSAIKVAGTRSYARVRAGEEVSLPPRPVTVARFERVAEPRRVEVDGVGVVVDVDVVVECSSGTYVRALARDVGDRLGVGGHLTVLRRHLVGPFSVEGAGQLPPRDEEWSASEGLVFPLRSLADGARAVFPVRALSSDEAVDIGHGKRLPLTGVPGTVAAIAPSGELAALLHDVDGAARPLLVVPPGEGS